MRKIIIFHAFTTGGLFALGAHTDPNVSGNPNPALDQRITRHMKIAEGITNTCHESYIRTHTRLGKEIKPVTKLVKC